MNINSSIAGTNVFRNSMEARTGGTLESTTTGKSVLDMNDFYKLMAAQLQNQDMTNPMSQSEFMNQMTQMTVIQSINTFTDISVTTYAASLVGKEVTVAEVDSKGEITEVFGTVTATGLYGGEQIIFVNGKSYKLAQIMSVGKLPEKEEPENPDVDPENPDVDPEIRILTKKKYNVNDIKV